MRCWTIHYRTIRDEVGVWRVWAWTKEDAQRDFEMFCRVVGGEYSTLLDVTSVFLAPIGN